MTNDLLHARNPQAAGELLLEVEILTGLKFIKEH
jgi:hypothetical protein